EKIEGLANEAVYKNLSTEICYPSAQELIKLDYRSKKELLGKIRIVTIPDIDCCACCGTHVKRLGEIGIIKLSPPQKYKGGVRISILCGGKALEDYREKVNSITNISRLFSAKPEEAFQIVKLRCEETEKLKAKLNEIEDKLFLLMAEKMDGGSEPLCVFEESFEPNDLRKLCMAIVNKREGAVAVVSGSDEKGYRYAIGVRDGDLRDSGKLLNKELNGRGGGDKKLILGTFNASLEDIKEKIKNIL
ncbi:MAG: DHHA1 domain-containing protein, partial [Oscillospiraceae bacterium]